MRIRLNRKRIEWLIIAAVVLTLGIVIPLLVLGSPERDLTIASYSDVVRFQADGVATLQVRIFDLSGKVVWDSSVVSGDTIDWDRNNGFGERLAYGAYIYSAQGWTAQGGLDLQEKGKLALMPGDKVQLQAAPGASSSSGQKSAPPVSDTSLTLKPMAVNVDHSTESWAFGQIGIGTTSPNTALHINGGKLVIQSTRGSYGQIQIANPDIGEATLVQVAGVTGGYGGILTSSSSKYIWALGPGSYGTTPDKFNIGNNYLGKPLLSMDATTGQIGIGTTTPTATLEVHGSATNLLALYDPVAPTDAKFRVEKDGDVYADGTYYCVDGAFHVGSADVAERINTSEWVEAGCVVEIDPEHPGFFRKSTSAYSTKVAGIISTSPGVILGNSFDEATDDWEDNRPVLAVTGRVPCSVSTENGPIEIGDLLVASCTPGVAMKGNSEESMGAVVGKAMERLETGTGIIVVQVMLR